MNSQLILFLKGMLMGISDLLPGISGGTIAFITGIYQRLIAAISSFDLHNFIGLFDGNKRANILKKLDLSFLCIVFAGVLTSILLGARAISFLLEQYTIYLLAFFIGLIAASSKIIYNHIENHTSSNLGLGVLGFVIGLFFVLASPTTLTNPTLIHIFFGGMIAVLALFLPGISGSFILLVFGLYEYIINAVKNISANLETLGVFVIGAIIGALGASKAINALFKWDKCKTLYILLGIVIGSLGVPLRMIVEEQGVISFVLGTKLLLLFLLGVGIVFMLEKKR